MSFLVKSARIVCEGNPFHLQQKDILIDHKGIISKIGDNLDGAKQVIESPNLHVSIGWFDMRANFNDPGNEHKEDLQSGKKAAAAGGFSEVAILPNTKPVLQSKNDIHYLTKGNAHGLVKVYPIAAVTHDCKGEELTEMIDLHTAGAVAFSDGEQPIWNTDILYKSLLYLQKFDGLLINKPEDMYLNAFGNMHEGKQSTILGLKGMPDIAEGLMINRDIRLLRYAGGRIHFSNISSGASVKLVKNAQKKELQVSCDVAAHQLVFNDSYLMDYDTNYKVNPPLRDAKDQKALKKALNEGVVTVITSSHIPQDEESKNLEFDLADFGMSGLQTFWPYICSASERNEWINWINTFTCNPRVLLGIPVPEIMEGAAANLTLFDPDMDWLFNAETNLSRSQNSPSFNQQLKGKVIGLFANGKHHINP